jgi:hypothetical protein
MKVNLFSPDEVRIWMKSFMDGDDVDFEQMEKGLDLELGQPPEWIRDYEDVGFDHVIKPGPYFPDYDKPWRFTHRATFLLQEGLAPGQPFLVSFKPPHWYRCGGYEYPEEWDCDYDWSIVKKANWSWQRSVRAWQTFLKSAPEAQELEKKIREREEERHRKAAKYHAVLRIPHYGSSMDDYGPDKERLELVSILKTQRNLHGSRTLACGESVGIWEDEAAYAALLKATQKEGFPYTLEQLKKLPVRTR